MYTNALSKLTYGLCILSSKHHDKSSGCIIHTCIPIGSNPNQILISVVNTNYTRKLIAKSGVFCVAILSQDCPFELIKHFGFQSGRDVKKFDKMTTFEDLNGVPCTLSYVCATISARVLDKIDLGSHTVFIGMVNDQKVLNEGIPLTYNYYEENIKPQMHSAKNKSANVSKCILESEDS